MIEHRLSGPIHQAFSHMLLLGLATIAEQEGLTGVRVHWTDDMDPCPVLSVDQPWKDVCEAVRNHAIRLNQKSSWLWQETVIEGKTKALFSPRAGTPVGGEWPGLVAQRHQQVAALSDVPSDRASLRLIGSLGMPAYWGRVRSRKIQVDDGASRWEMTHRIQGRDFLKTRFRPLCEGVATRSPEQVSDALRGLIYLDHSGRPSAERSRLSAGLRLPQRTDAVTAWCALWGIACFPIAHHLNAVSGTAGYVDEFSRGRFVIPVPGKPFTLASMRAVCSSRYPGDAIGAEATDADSAKTWLCDRGVPSVVAFPLHVTMAKVPEMWADSGTVLSTRQPGVRE